MPGATVLVIDDSPTILKLVQLVLTKSGYHVAAASSGEAGLLAAREEPPSLILLDHVLPDFSAYDLCGAMSADTVLSGIPVIIMAAPGHEIEEGFRGVGNVVDYVTKPFSPEALLTVVGHRLEQKPATGAADAAPAVNPALSLVPSAPAPESTAHPAPADAALSGNLAVISIADILALLADQGQTGVLTLAHGSTRLEAHFKDGRVAFATAIGVAEEFLLGRFLVEAKQLTPAVLATVIDERSKATGRRALLGADLITRGLLTADGLNKAMVQQIAALVYEGLRWDSGRFWFLPQKDLSDAAEEASAGLAIDSLLMEGFRRVDEWRLIEREIRDFELVFVRNDYKVDGFGVGKLTRDEQAVLEFVNGKNTVKDIIYLTNMGSFDVTKMLYRLLRTKLIRRRVGPMAV